ncbi:acyltransferase domain-containing protein [Nocardioides panacihumi]|uniref:Acyltransferase domain-containing protein n=1 Tax=Nocardioides panacihumi TaxID=400774 RepID=A0ABN2RL97_9ACTN
MEPDITPVPALAPPDVPTADDIARYLDLMAATPEVFAALLAARDDFDAAPDDLRAAIRAIASAVRAGLGVIGAEAPVGVPQEPDARPAQLYGDVLALLACIPSLVEYHAARGVPEHVTWDTLADLPRYVTRHEELRGRPGFDELRWLSNHLRGLLYAVGRLQFERVRSILLPDAQVGVTEVVGELADDEILLNVHIPATGSLDSDECEAAYAAALEQFALWHPEERPKAFVCLSWLMDPQLREYLPVHSNIIRFQDRYRIVGTGMAASWSMQEFVFRVSGQVDPETLPQRTTLERAFTQHLRSGREWNVRTGCFPV